MADRALSALLPLCLLATLAACIAFSDAVGFRHSFVFNSPSCAVRQVRHLPEHTDFIAIGSSRVRRGIDMGLLEADPDLELRGAFNFGRPGRNPARNLAMLQDILDRGIRPGHIYVEIDLDALASVDDGLALPVMRDASFLTWQHLWSMSLSPQSRPWLERLHLGLRHLHAKLNGAIVNTVSGQYLGLQKLKTGPHERVCWRDSFDTPTATNQFRKARGKQQFEARFGDLSQAWDQEFVPGRGWRFETELDQLQKLRELARSHGIGLVISRHWAAYQPPLTPQSIERIQALVPEFVYPDESLVRSSWDGFFDQSHMDSPARAQFTNWLIEQLKSPSNQ